MAATGEATNASRRAEPPGALYNKLRPGPGMTANEVASHQCARIHGAMIEIAGTGGYREVTVREVASRAGVSTRAFYAHFQDKDDCVLRTYELVVQQAAARIVAAQSGERDWRERMRRAFEAFAREMGQRPRAARLALVEPYAIGSAALERAHRTECLFEAMLAESLARAPGSIRLSPLVVKGMVAGVSRIARAQLLAGREGELFELSSDIQRWVLSLHDAAAGELRDLAAPTLKVRPAPMSPRMTAPAADGSIREGDRALILTAVAKLAASKGYEALTVPRIRSAAGVSRRKFDSHFDGAQDCFLASLEQRATSAVSIASAHAPEGNWACDVHITIAHLCAHIANDPLLSRLAFVDVFAAGPAGLRCRERIITQIAESFATGPVGEAPEALAAEASVGAIWAVLHDYVTAGRTHELPRIAPTLSYLALAPAVGATAAVEAIRGAGERR